MAIYGCRGVGFARFHTGWLMALPTLALPTLACARVAFMSKPTVMRDLIVYAKHVVKFWATLSGR